jgi:hypothetical protein
VLGLQENQLSVHPQQKDPENETADEKVLQDLQKAPHAQRNQVNTKKIRILAYFFIAKRKGISYNVYVNH